MFYSCMHKAQIGNDMNKEVKIITAILTIHVILRLFILMNLKVGVIPLLFCVRQIKWNRF